MEKTALIIFAKYPELGKVKTRLAAETSDIFATEFYKASLKDTLGIALKLKKITPFVFIPEKNKEFAAEFGVMPKHQAGNTLGDRIYNAFKEIQKHGYQKILIIGTDSPELSEQTITRAASELDESDTVIGPSHDGGYYLLGLNSKALQETLFQTINWSTNTVFEETRKKINDQDLSSKILPIGYDIDHYKDIINLQKRVEKDSEFDKSKTMNFLKSAINP